MTKGIIVVEIPNCCGECFALDDNGDYPVCLVTQEQRGYTFNIRDQRMDKCPIKPLPEKIIYQSRQELSKEQFAEGWNACVEEMLGE